MKTQEEIVLDHLKAGRTLTQLQAAREYGCLRLAARIHLLRKAGYQIETETETGGGKHWARYRLIN